MAKKRTKAKVKDNPKDTTLKHFFLGVSLFIIIETIFMLGGLFVENKMGISVTGIPSAIGVTIVLLLGLFLYKKSEYILLGSFTFAFLTPFILYLVMKFNAMTFLKPHIYLSLGYSLLLILAVWLYYINKIIREDL